MLKHGGRGSSLMALEADETLIQAIVCGADGVVVSGTGNGGKAVEETLSLRAMVEYRGARGRKGRPLTPRRKGPSLSLPRPPGKAGA
jgi:topoisomerase-4 subunit A